MRTKTLLLTAALSAAGLATSMAQVYSVNAVGYVNQTIPANGWSILGVPLNGTNNSLNTTLALPDTAEGCNVFRFDPTTQSYRDAATWIAGLGWLSASDPDPTVNPGEGFFFQNTTGVALNHTFVGEVPSGTLNNPVVGGNQWSILSSIVPKNLRLGDLDPSTGGPTTLEFPADEGDTVYIFDPATQQYKDAYTYVATLGWLSASDPDLDGPLVAPGTGFFVQKTVARTWVQTFSVN
jgi:hypothetical protein